MRSNRVFEKTLLLLFLSRITRILKGFRKLGNAKRFEKIARIKDFEKVGSVKETEVFSLIITDCSESIHLFAVIPGLIRDLLQLNVLF
jgi:hypothetical protein